MSNSNQGVLGPIVLRTGPANDDVILFRAAAGEYPRGVCICITDVDGHPHMIYSSRSDIVVYTLPPN